MKCEESADVGESTEEGNGEKEEGVLGIAGCVFLLHSLDEVVLLFFIHRLWTILFRIRICWILERLS